VWQSLGAIENLSVNNSHWSSVLIWQKRLETNCLSTDVFTDVFVNLVKQTPNAILWTMCNISFVFQTIHTKLGICVYNHICNKMASANKRQLPTIVLLNSTEGTLVAKSISWNVRKVSIGCDHWAHLWQLNELNEEYITQTVILITHKIQTPVWLILVRIFNHCNLIQFITS